MGRVSRLTETQLPVVFMPFPPAPSSFPSFTHFPSGPGRVEGRLKGDTRRYGGKAGELHFPACNAEEGNA